MQIKYTKEIQSLLKDQKLCVSFDEGSKEIDAYVSVFDVEFYFSKPLKKCKCVPFKDKFDYYAIHNNKCINSTKSLTLNQKLTIDHLYRKGFVFKSVEIDNFFSNLSNTLMKYLRFSLKNENQDLFKINGIEFFVEYAEKIKFYSNLLELIKKQNAKQYAKKSKSKTIRKSSK